MRAPDLVVGAKYIIKRAGNVSAVYEGKHEGKIACADGSTFYGSNGALRFRFKNPQTGHEELALLENGSEVEEAEATKLERERITAERRAREEAALLEAKGFIEELGFVIVDRWYRSNNDPLAIGLGYPKEAANEIEVEGVTIGKLRSMLAASHIIRRS